MPVLTTKSIYRRQFWQNSSYAIVSCISNSTKLLKKIRLEQKKRSAYKVRKKNGLTICFPSISHHIQNILVKPVKLYSCFSKRRKKIKETEEQKKI